jgi:hypothetical protein
MITVSDGADDATITVTIAVENDTSDDTVANNEPEFVDGSTTDRRRSPSSSRTSKATVTRLWRTTIRSSLTAPALPATWWRMR